MTVDCPQCNGKNEIETAEYEFLTCIYCKNSLYIDFDGISLTYTYSSIISSDEVVMFLKKDFEKTGFSENYRIINQYPLYMPFWGLGESDFLESASSKIDAGKIPKPSQERRIFDLSEMAESVEKEDPDSQPDIEDKRSLYYLPFYKIVINFKDKEYQFYVDALSGRIFGEPIPFMSAKEIGKYFPFFILMLITFFFINLLFNNVFVLIFLNIVLIYLFFNLSLAEFVKKLYKNES